MGIDCVRCFWRLHVRLRHRVRPWVEGQRLRLGLAPGFTVCCLPSDRVINGVKEMCGFRMAMNLSYSSSSNESCTESGCTDSVTDSTILVNHPPTGGGVACFQCYGLYMQGLIVSVFSLGCLVGALLAGGVSNTN